MRLDGVNTIHLGLAPVLLREEISEAGATQVPYLIHIGAPPLQLQQASVPQEAPVHSPDNAHESAASSHQQEPAIQTNTGMGLFQQLASMTSMQVEENDEEQGASAARTHLLPTKCGDGLGTLISSCLYTGPKFYSDIIMIHVLCERGSNRPLSVVWLPRYRPAHSAYVT